MVSLRVWDVSSQLPAHLKPVKPTAPNILASSTSHCSNCMSPWLLRTSKLLGVLSAWAENSIPKISIRKCHVFQSNSSQKMLTESLAAAKAEPTCLQRKAAATSAMLFNRMSSFCVLPWWGFWKTTTSLPMITHVVCNAKQPPMLFTLLDLCVSSLRSGYSNLLCIVPTLADDPRRESRTTPPISQLSMSQSAKLRTTCARLQRLWRHVLLDSDNNNSNNNNISITTHTNDNTNK